MTFKSYLAQVNNPDLSKSIEKTAKQAWENIESFFDYKSHVNSLLLGNVQSGKTAQTFGIISKLAEKPEFKVFIYLTTDNLYLHKQTYERALTTLKEFDIVSENDYIRFTCCDFKSPILIILKKNTNILKKWRGNLFSYKDKYLGRPFIIIDDEADAASLNTKINKREVSQINKHLASIKDLSTSSLYIQVTATPQSILLQTQISGWRPSFVNYFPPGKGYVGGDFVYSTPVSYCIRFTNENELDEIREGDHFIPEGLRKSLMSFLAVCGHYVQKGQDTCSYLIHPSVRINDHEVFARTIGEHLNYLLSELEDPFFDLYLKDAWEDLQKTAPDITHFEDIKNNIVELLSEQNINIFVLNSKSPITEYSKGFNILVGGNSLGRGLTLPKLQTVYYCRKSKSPQADTFWQHSRMFGYDREQGLMRIFIPPTLHKIFTELNEGNRVLVNQIEKFGIEGVQLIYPKNIKPTRKNVIDNDFANFITGGVNFFPNEPIQNNAKELDSLLEGFKDEKVAQETSINLLNSIMDHVGSNNMEDWDRQKYIDCIQSLSVKRPSIKCHLIVRRNRNISKGTGTLLSPTDRILGDKYKDSIVLTLYRVNGKRENGWEGKPFWVSNIKFPHNTCFYDMRNK